MGGFCLALGSERSAHTLSNGSYLLAPIHFRYEPHFDYGEACDYEENLMNGHRHVTMLVYLNSVPEEYDGRTHFPKLGVTIAPTAYNALVFNDCLPNGQEDPRTLHGGAPPAAGYTEAKIAINIWIRAAPWVRRDQRITAAA